MELGHATNIDIGSKQNHDDDGVEASHVGNEHLEQNTLRPQHLAHLHNTLRSYAVCRTGHASTLRAVIVLASCLLSEGTGVTSGQWNSTLDVAKPVGATLEHMRLDTQHKTSEDEHGKLVHLRERAELLSDVHGQWLGPKQMTTTHIEEVRHADQHTVYNNILRNHDAAKH